MEGAGSSSNPNKKKVNSKDEGGHCPTCEVKVKPKDIIQLATDGTGFSSKGKAKVDKETIAFS